MLAILSDIHSNLEALQSVLADIDRRKISQIYCLGDIVGCGPDPAQCLAHCQKFDLCIKGDWDLFVASSTQDVESKDSKPLAKCDWTRSQLSRDELSYLSRLKTSHTEGELTFAHGSPLDNVRGYLFPEVVYERDEMARQFAAFEGLFACGHTHLPGVFHQNKFMEPTEIDFRFDCDENPAIVNVGSVGQPRDGDPRACYVIYDGSSFEFVRLEYDWDTTKRKMDDLSW